MIRSCTLTDLAAVTRIYGHYVQHSTATFETTPPDQDEMTRRYYDVLSKQLPWLVWEQAGQVVGFAYGNWFKPRPAYRFSVENSIYLDPEYLGQGGGKALMMALFTALEAADVRKVMAVIGDSANHASVALHRACGFELVGTVQNCGWKFDRWLDIVLMQRSLGVGSTEPPYRP